MSGNHENLVSALRKALRRPWAVQQAVLVCALNGGKTGRRRGGVAAEPRRSSACDRALPARCPCW